jgi:RNA polymerase sigma-70 factor (TIGR02960 family)
MEQESAVDVDFAAVTERHRRELQVHCYRMLGSFEEAEDLVQETLLRAWRRRGDLQDGNSLRAWLYKIATNACLDALKAKKRRVPSLSSFRDIPWLEPYPDRLLDQAAPHTPDPQDPYGQGHADDPQAVTIGRETIELTFLAVIQLLPPRQRAALVLRDVLDWPVGRVAELLDQSPTAVNSALQRARATLRTQRPPAERDGWVAGSTTATEREVLDRYIRAYEAGDTEATLSLVSDDIRVTMPPYRHLFEGREAIQELGERARATGDWRLLPTSANRQPAAACYLRDPESGRFEAFKIDVLRVVDGRITEITAFGPRQFPDFDLPLVLT